jgi:outer membrane scaffolding protein for murein synthesis (MipA/OmpV family)
VPKWNIVLGAAMVTMPRYDGAMAYHAQLGPVIDIRYRDIAFASVGEGLGVNLLRGRNYRAGISIGYDLGRRVSDYPNHLRGLGDLHAAPVIKAFGSYAISKKFPLVLRVDVRKIAGGAGGIVGDIEAFMPLPGSSKRLIMLAGPSMTFADREHMQKTFGVSDSQALASRYSSYAAHGGLYTVGLGFSATRFLTDHVLVTGDVAVNRLMGSARASPITQNSVQGVLALSMAYRW